MTTTQFAREAGLPYTTVVRWAQQGLIPNVEKEETPRGPVWLIPQSALDTLDKWRPKAGRPPNPKVEDKKGKAK